MTWPRVIGQHRVKNELLSALRNDRLPHAYLFYGNDGVGKDAMALELARVIHCEKGGEQPCDECSSCRQMNTLQHPDVRFVMALPVGKSEKSDDGPFTKLTPDDMQSIHEQIRLKAENAYHHIAIPRATTVRINSIRELRRESAMSTSDGRRRVFIVSRADEMNAEASNAILKTLEEPSGHSMLILTTSQRDTLLPTILSRCQNVRFDLLTDPEIAEALVNRNNVTKETATLVARLANGSFVRALELLDEDIVRERQDVLMFIRESLANNVVLLSNRIEELSSSKEREPVRRFLSLLLLWFRDALVLRHGGVIINVDQQEDLQRFVAKFPDADLTGVVADIEQAVYLIDRNVYIKLVYLQLAVQLKRNIMNTSVSTTKKLK
ncbi:MAG: DNA polymerase III subunit delta' [Bacteroidota bacterium]